MATDDRDVRARSPAREPGAATAAASSAPRPMCFVAMPFGQKAPPGKKKPLVNFDIIAKSFQRAVEAEGLEYRRADMEKDGGFINREMYERLLVAEYALADITFANANVMYELGVRHGASARPTLLLGAGTFLGKLPFDLQSLRIVTYELTTDGVLGESAASALEATIRDRLRAMKKGTFPSDNPIVQITAWRPQGRASHEKVDVFLDRLKYAGEIGEEIATTLAQPESAQRVDRLADIERRVLGDGEEIVEQLYTTVLGIFLGYRELGAYDRMVALYERMRDLQQTVVVREQYAFALNRLAEAAEKRANKLRAASEPADAVRTARDEATAFRNGALRALDAIPETGVTSETFGIRGRVYKTWADAEEAAGTAASAQGKLQRAIEFYEEGFRRDLRDFYPGVNAVTLRVFRDAREDQKRAAELLPVVRFAVDSAPPAKNEEERDWRAATRLELACVARDWTSARNRLTDTLAVEVGQKQWMRATTVGTLKRLRARYAAAAEDTRELDAITADLER